MSRSFTEMMEDEKASAFELRGWCYWLDNACLICFILLLLSICGNIALGVLLGAK